ncbi:ribonuclease P protein component [Halodesulfovibrio sp.]|uniref:ribonuclease P protein component n=1 Tax=Halodesulfovibrio sp. TaxID=1912772 RepID=UPI003457D079
MICLTFPRTHRLTRRPEFVKCYDEGRRYFSKNFVLFVLEKEDPTALWRVGLAVTKKTGSAVQRNRVKRVLREFFRLNQRELPNGIDFVVVPKRRMNPEHVDLSFVTQELLPIIHKLRERSAQDGEDEA